MVIILSNLIRSSKFFNWKILLKICSKEIITDLTAPCTCCHTTFWNINVAKKQLTTNYKVVQLHAYGVMGMSVIKLRKVYCWVCQWKKIKIREYFEKWQARMWLSRALYSFFTARCYASAVLAHGPVSVRLSVRPSVTSRCSTKTAKRRITQTTPHDSPWTLVFGCQRSPRNSTGLTPCVRAKYRWGGSKSATLDK